MGDDSNLPVEDDDEERDLSMLVGPTGINNSSYLSTIPEDSNELVAGGGGMIPSLNLENINKTKRSPHAPSEISSTKAVEPESEEEPAAVVSIRPSKQPSTKPPKPSSPALARRQLAAIIVLAIVLVAAVAIATLKLHQSGEDDDNDDETIVEPLPSLAPTSDESFFSFFLPENFEEMLSQASSKIPGYTGGNNYTNVLLDYGTPQGKARDWLIGENAWVIGSENELLQRYALLVFYFSTRSPSTREGIFATTYLDPAEHECDWFRGGLMCTTNTTTNTKRVEILNLSATNTSGSLPMELTLLTGLRELDLHNNVLEGTIPPTVAWQNLYYLDLSVNYFTGTVPTDLWSLPILRFVFLSYNDLSGTFPTEASPSSLLEQIWVRNNFMTDSLPSWLTTRPKLTSFIASYNNFSGSLPTAWEEASSLTYLELGSNQLSGSLPESLLMLSNLTHLYLENNTLDGSLPPSQQGTETAAASSNLRLLWLQGNSFTGEVAADFGSAFVNMKEVEIQNNPSLTGTLQCDQWPTISEIHADCGAASRVQVECACTNCSVVCH